MKRITLFVLLGVLLISCSNSESEMPTQSPLPTYTLYPTYTPLPTFTPFPTWTPEPTVTPLPTQNPVTEINITDYLYIEGDLPDIFLVRMESSSPPPRYDGITNAEKVSYHQIAKDYKDTGSVGIFLFDDLSDTERAYTESIANVMGSFVMQYTEGDIGDKSRVTWFDFGTVTVGGVRYADYEFLHCGMVVSITLTGKDFSLEEYVEIVSNYAELLDSRLSPLVCELN